jgi:putative glutathione S-transferase
MGQLENGRWIITPVAGGRGGQFERRPSTFRNWITPDGQPGPSGDGGFPAESGRYRLYVSLACPWAHRTLIMRELKDLADHIAVDVVHPDMLEDGWTFASDFPGATGDRLYGSGFLRDIYLRADPNATTKVTVPVLWDTQRQTIVSNESAEIIRMFDSAFDDLTGNHARYAPEDLVDDIDALNARIYPGLNNGVYRSGFARTQEAYDEAVLQVFETLDWLDQLLRERRYLTGDRVTEADIRLLPTLIRFDLVYHTHFKCNRKWLRDYRSLWAYTRDLCQLPGVAGTIDQRHIVRHYHYSHETINPFRIIPINPVVDFSAPHDRARLSGRG